MHAEFQKKVMKKRSLRGLISKFSVASASQNSEAADPSHAAMLKSCIRRAGFDHVDRQVSYALKKWLASYAESIVWRLLGSEKGGQSTENKRDKKTALDISVIIGGLWKDLGDLIMAEPMYRCVLQLREEIMGIDNIKTIKALQNLATLLQALHSQQETLQQLDSKTPRRKANDLNNGQDHLAEAELLFRRALVKQEQILGLTNSQTLQSIHNFAVFCQKYNKYREAELLYRRAFTGFEKVHGKLHDHTLQAGHNLASLLHEKGDSVEAVSMYKDIYEGRVAVLGGEDPKTLQTQGKLGLLYQETGDIVEAENIFRQLITMYMDTDGQGSTTVIDSKSMLASCLIDSKQYEEAETVLEEVISSRRNLLGEADPATLAAASDLASLHFSQDRFATAEKMYRSILKYRLNALGKNDISTLDTMTKVAAVCYAGDELTEAVSLYKQALSGYKRVLGKSNNLTMQCVDMLARLLKQQGLFQEALPYFEKSLAHYSEVMGPGSPDAANMLGCCGMCHRAVGNDKKGKAMLKEAIGKLRVALKEEPSKSPAIKSIKRRILRFEASLDEEPVKLKTNFRRSLSVSFDNGMKAITGGLRKKSSFKHSTRSQSTKVGAWTQPPIEMKSDEPMEEDRHLKPAGLAVAATHRLMAFARPRVKPVLTNSDVSSKVGENSQVRLSKPKTLVVRGARGPRGGQRTRGAQPRPPKGAPPLIKISPKNSSPPNRQLGRHGPRG